MSDDFSSVLIKRPLPHDTRLAVALPVGLSLILAVRDCPVWAAVALLLVPGLLAVGDKFELDTVRRRYREGYHWAHWLNPAWQQLPLVQGVVVKPYRYRMLARSKYGSELSDAGIWEGYTVLLSVPNSRLGVVVASVEDEAEAEAIAAEVAGALQVPWQQIQ
jgi:hypothetical protein